MVSINKPPLKRGKVGGIFLMGERRKRGIAAVPLLSGVMLIDDLHDTKKILSTAWVLVSLLFELNCEVTFT